eukprot:gene19224-23557_t
MLLFSIWLFRHPASVHDNGRIGIGLTLLLIAVSALCHIFGGQPQPGNGVQGLSDAGGVLGWVLASPLLLASAFVAVPVVVMILVLSLFIMTKTPPNRIGDRFRELYSYLFGAQLAERVPKEKTAAVAETSSITFGTLSDLGLDQQDPATLPWWRRSKSVAAEEAFDSPVIGRGNTTEAIGAPASPR